MKQSPIFVKHFDLMAWLIPCTLRFPKSHRGGLARKIQEELYRIDAGLVEAATSQDPRPGLDTADRALISLRTYLRLSRTLGILPINHYEHAVRLAAEVGKLLGGWRKKAATV